MSRSDVESNLGFNQGPKPGFKRLRLTLAYCGTPWKGWQSQPGGETVQDKLAAAMLRSIKCVVDVQGSGRTDAGVHAIGQVAHCDVPDRLGMSTEGWLSALNACLPLTIRVTEVQFCDPMFHARFSAIGKIYHYDLCTDPILPPLKAGLAWHLPRQLDVDVLWDALALFIGRHDFHAFAAYRGNETPDIDWCRTIESVELTTLQDGYQIS